MQSTLPRITQLLALAACLAACNEAGNDGSSDTGEETAETETSDSAETETSAGETEAGETEAGETEVGETETDGTDTAATGTVTVSGNAFTFGVGSESRVSGATITILEMPEQQAITDDDGYFEFTGLPNGAEASFRLEKDGNPVVHTKTFTLPEEEGATVEHVTFQVPNDATFDALATILQIEPSEDLCQIASTVTRVGKSLYDAGAHGEAGATVTIEPALPEEAGPVYFNADVIPQHDLVETSADGGVVYTNVPPGTYTLTAHKEGVEFETVTVRCEASVLANPSPPYGLQAL
ncbi:hypothetical protein G6O69_20770 [Pseudenhygromyxa sp. WMMC2535]|uniref:hypothetical protein n=1 Tax=Pseudenhygromyxa sp. WMMC2535 TaxID=2712867 RepID=UPI001556CC6B|nr:hypothetical protein [Pseudenhygromyxa sp. WMMC2535]NVB40288.1 hypothetical protein [Pseudenhygromyxa sp. WMMC2535]